MTQLVEESRSAISVRELQRAWNAVRAGQFRAHPPARMTRTTSTFAKTWSPSAPVLPVVGCAGAVGASTFSLAIATAADGPARVIECSPITASGLAAASTAELGVHVSGWVQGTRDQVVLERTGMVLVGVHEVPEPSEPERDVHLTVLDVGWELGQVMATPSWLSEHLRAAPLVVLVTVATIPGLSRLEGALGLLGPGRAVVAVRVPRRKKWAKGVEHSAGPLTQHLLQSDLVVEVPHDHYLWTCGLDSAPLPTPLLDAAAHTLRLPHPETP